MKILADLMSCRTLYRRSSFYICIPIRCKPWRNQTCRVSSQLTPTVRETVAADDDSDKRNIKKDKGKFLHEICDRPQSNEMTDAASSGATAKKLDAFKGVINQNPLHSYSKNRSGEAIQITRIVQKLHHMATSGDYIRSDVLVLCNFLEEFVKLLTPLLCSQLLFAMSKFHMQNEPLINKIVRQAQLLLPSIKVYRPVLSDILLYMCWLGNRDVQFLNSVVKWFNGYSAASLHDVGDLFHSLALLNYVPNKANKILQEHLKDNKLENHKNSISYVNFCWALSLIGCIDENTVEHVLSRDFKERMEKILPPQKLPYLHLKLGHIFVHAKMKGFETSNDTPVSNNAVIKNLKQKRGMDPEIRDVLNAVIHLFPKGVRNYVEIDSGFIVDAVYYFDKSGPVDVQTDTDLSKVQKVAFIVLKYADLYLPDKTLPTAIINFHRNYLEYMGYNVVFVPFNKYPFQDSLKVKSQYFVNKLKHIVPDITSK